MSCLKRFLVDPSDSFLLEHYYYYYYYYAANIIHRSDPRATIIQRRLGQNYRSTIGIGTSRGKLLFSLLELSYLLTYNDRISTGFRHRNFSLASSASMRSIPKCGDSFETRTVARTGFFVFGFNTPRPKTLPSSLAVIGPDIGDRSIASDSYKN